VPAVNLSILLICQFIAVSGSVLVVTVGGLVGTELASDARLATLPLSIMVVGTALATLLASMTMQRFGRRLGFMLAALIAASGAALAAQGLQARSFALFCVGVALLGVNNAFVQQYRFAAAESVVLANVGRAISLILLGAIGGAFFGPILATQTSFRFGDHALIGGFVGLAVMQVAAMLLLGGLRGAGRPTADIGDVGGTQRPLMTIATQPAFIVAVMGGAVGYAAMTLIMTATPLSMHVGDGHSLQDTAWVIRSHVVAMYAPSLFSGVLIERWGAARIMMAGVIAIAATLAFGLQGHAVMHYWWALVLLGLGWNFLYVGGTAHLVRTYYPAERFKAQAVNEFTVFGTSAIASLMAGTLFAAFGWNVVLWSAVPLLLVMVCALSWPGTRTVAAQ
jgi:MFS family permease